jgi:hypothetical protein|tara:strand:+ start:2944 stop:3714 length:771 start_codon:yes stop_codon:yes gene_type:complete
MELQQLKENKLTTLKRVLDDVFSLKLDFNAPSTKLEAMKESTQKKITSLRENGQDVSNKDFQKLLLIAEGMDMAIEKKKLEESADLDQAEVLLAAKQMADDLQKMAENLASMQVEDLMSIHNAMKEQVGTAEADAFNSSAEAAIGAALDAVKSANEQVGNAVLTAQGMAPETTDMDMPMGEPEGDMDLGLDAPMDEPAMDDDFGGADAADVDSDIDGREMKEDAYLSAVRTIKEAQAEGKVSPAILKQAFAQLKKK